MFLLLLFLFIVHAFWYYMWCLRGCKRESPNLAPLLHQSSTFGTAVDIVAVVIVVVVVILFVLDATWGWSNREAPNLALLTTALEQQHLHQLFRIVPTQQKAAGPTRWSLCKHIVRQDTVKRKEWKLLCFGGTATMLLAVMITCLFFSPGTRARSKHRQVSDLKSFKKDNYVW